MINKENQSHSIEVKSNSKNTQLKLFKAYLETHIATCTMACKALGIDQKNACRYKARLQKQGHLVEVYKDRCKNTSYLANYLSTNPTIIKEVNYKMYNQLSMFD